ncbi:MAG TPA: replication endonuclease, partial [Telluria sp.]|nr:replication endonuclease [Telluria sp.]
RHELDTWGKGIVARFPHHLAGALAREYDKRRNRPLRKNSRRGVLDDGREAEANNWLRAMADMLPANALDLSAGEDELIAFAKERAGEGGRLELDGATGPMLAAFCRRYGMPTPTGKALPNKLKRAACSLWWRRNLRRENGRTTETIAIALGQVHRHAGLYVSDDAVKRRQSQKRRNRALLEALTAINELGQEFSLVELADKGMANPAIKRAELMTRIAGFEYIAVGMGHAGEFVTLTAPSRFHARHAESGQRNGKYKGFIPRETQDYLCGVWSRIMADLDRREIRIYGFRVAEPHHDGTPHLHGLFFMEPGKVDEFRRVVAKHAVRSDREELGLSYLATEKEAKAIARSMKARGAVGTLKDIATGLMTERRYWAAPPDSVWKAIKARVKLVAIDWEKGTAAGYIAKYIAKNIDGQRQDGGDVGEDWEAVMGTKAVDSAVRVDAWASTWGIRQFQQVGGPPVGVWRELRRWEYEQAEDVLMQAAAAADTGNWSRFVEVMGGHEARRREMPLTLAKDMAAPNRYGEQAEAPTKVFGVAEVATGQLARTRLHEWTVLNGREAAAWTRVNNSTILTERPARPATSEEKWRVAHADKTDVRPLSQAEWHQVLADSGHAMAPDEEGRRYTGFFMDRAEQDADPESFAQRVDRLINGHMAEAEQIRADTAAIVAGRRLQTIFRQTHSLGLAVLTGRKPHGTETGTTTPRSGEARNGQPAQRGAAGQGHGGGHGGRNGGDVRRASGAAGIADQLAASIARASSWLKAI